MALDGLSVSFSEQDAARIPDVLLRGALSLVPLARGGGLSNLAELVQIRRSGGFAGLDVWLLLWMYFASGSTTGMKRFWEVAGPVSKRLAALAGRTKLASPPSVSRALSAVENDLLRPSADALLLATADSDAVLRHPAVHTYDTLGDGWHCFDFDPTVTALRHRALPASEGLPEHRRNSESTGIPGYKGRKRGDVGFPVEVDDVRARPKFTLVAEETADRQRRRKTWEQNVARHALPKTARISLDIACPGALRRWLGDEGSRDAGVGGTV